MTRIIEKDLSYKITRLCFKVQKKLGRFCREKQYSDEFEKLLKLDEIRYEREYNIIELNSESPEGNRVDFYVASKILVNFKAKNYITKEDYYQMLRYLSAARLELGMIVNFRDYHLKPKRVLNSDFDSGVNMNYSGRVLGIDYGEKRIGLAISDESQTIASEFGILSPKEFFNQLNTVVKSQEIIKIVLGWPLNMSGQMTEKTKEVEQFKLRLENSTGLPVEIIDERLSSHMAGQIKNSGRNLDSLSAQIILQNYLNKNYEKK